MGSIRQWWTVKELAKHYGLSSRTIYDAIASADLVAHRFGQGHDGTRIADEDRVPWEQQCKDGRAVRSWQLACRTVYGRKPFLFRELIEQVSPGPYLELCGREEQPNSGWTVYGNQVESRLF